MDFLDRKYPENPFVFLILSIPWHWWRLISIKCQLERLRSFFFQKIRFFYIFPYISIHNRWQNTNNVIRPPSGWGRSNFFVYFLYPTHKYFVGAVCICSPISFMPEHKMTLPLIWHILADETERMRQWFILCNSCLPQTDGCNHSQTCKLPKPLGILFSG